MKSNFKSAAAGFAIGLAVAAAGAQGAVQATQHGHPTPTAQTPSADAIKGVERMKDMDAMMADPARRQKMMEHMGQCHEIMSMMMEHMKHEGKMADQAPAPPKH